MEAYICLLFFDGIGRWTPRDGGPVYMMNTLLESKIEEAIILVAKRRIHAVKYFNSKLIREYDRTLKRSQRKIEPVKFISPSSWKVNSDFNPYFAIKNRKFLAYSIAKKIVAGDYKPRPPSLQKIAKKNGGHRKTLMFGVADEAVSRVFYEQLIGKNQPLMSYYSYAYRNDKTPMAAVNSIYESLNNIDDLILFEFDFKDFFNSIKYEYLEKVMNSQNFYISKLEKSIVISFLSASWTAQGIDNKTGIPPGTALSSFLANICLHELDKELEKVSNLSHYRFSDDTVIWSEDSQVSCRLNEIFNSWCNSSEVEINKNKSRFSDFTNETITPVNKSFQFLSHEFILDYDKKIYFTKEVEDRIKSKINNIIYTSLLKEPLMGTQKPSRFQGRYPKDRDYISTIFRLRTLIYGSLNERQITYFKNYNPNIFVPISGIHSYFYNVNDYEKLAKLDGWLVNQLSLALHKRGELLINQYPNMTSTPPREWFCTPRDLINHSVFSENPTPEEIDLTIPSFVRMNKFVNEIISYHGPQVCKVGQTFTKRENYIDSDISDLIDSY